MLRRMLCEHFPGNDRTWEGVAELWARAEDPVMLAEGLMPLLPSTESELSEAINQLSLAAESVYNWGRLEQDESRDGAARALFACLDHDGSGCVPQRTWDGLGLAAILRVS